MGKLECHMVFSCATAFNMLSLVPKKLKFKLKEISWSSLIVLWTTGSWYPGRGVGWVGTPILKVRGCSSEILKRTSERDQSGRGSSFFRPLKDSKILKRGFIFVYFFVRYRPLWLKILAFVLEHPKRDQKSQIYTPKRDDEHPRHFQKRLPPGLGMKRWNKS